MTSVKEFGGGTFDIEVTNILIQVDCKYGCEIWQKKKAFLFYFLFLLKFILSLTIF